MKTNCTYNYIKENKTKSNVIFKSSLLNGLRNIYLQYEMRERLFNFIACSIQFCFPETFTMGERLISFPGGSQGTHSRGGRMNSSYFHPIRFSFHANATCQELLL